MEGAEGKLPFQDTDDIPYGGYDIIDNPKYLSPFVPTKSEKIESILARIQFQPEDVLYDLGCGDCRMLISAVQKGCSRAVGVDMDPVMVARGQTMVSEAGLQGQISVLQADMMELDFSEATIIYVFLLEKALDLLQPKLLQLFATGPLRLVVTTLFDFKALSVRKEEDVQFGYYLYHRS